MIPHATFPFYFPKIRSNVIFPSTPRSSGRSLPFTFPNHNIICISHIPCVLHASPISYSLTWS